MLSLSTEKDEEELLVMLILSELNEDSLEKELFVILILTLSEDSEETDEIDSEDFVIEKLEELLFVTDLDEELFVTDIDSLTSELEAVTLNDTPETTTDHDIDEDSLDFVIEIDWLLDFEMLSEEIDSEDCEIDSELFVTLIDWLEEDRLDSRDWLELDFETLKLASEIWLDGREIELDSELSDDLVMLMLRL